MDELTIDGRYTSVQINWDGEDDVPIMTSNGWQVFCSGAKQFFTSYADIQALLVLLVEYLLGALACNLLICGLSVLSVLIFDYVIYFFRFVAEVRVDLPTSRDRAALQY